MELTPAMREALLSVAHKEHFRNWEIRQKTMRALINRGFVAWDAVRINEWRLTPEGRKALEEQK